MTIPVLSKLKRGESALADWQAGRQRPAGKILLKVTKTSTQTVIFLFFPTRAPLRSSLLSGEPCNHRFFGHNFANLLLSIVGNSDFIFNRRYLQLSLPIYCWILGSRLDFHQLFGAMAYQFVVNGVIFEPRFLTKDEWENFSSEDRLHWGKELRKYDGKAPQQTNDEEIIDRYNPNGEHFATLSFGPLITTEPSLMDFETVFHHLKFESMDDNGRAAIACLKEKMWPKLPSDLQKEIKSYDLVNMLALRESTTVPSNNNIIKQMKRLNVMSSAARSHAIIARLYWGHTHLHDTFREYKEIFENWENYPDLELGPAEGTTVKSQKKTPKSTLKTDGKKNNKDESSSKRQGSFQDADRPRKQTKIDNLISKNEDIETELGNYSRSIVKQGATLDSIKEGIKEHAKRIENLEQIDAGGIATAQKAQEAEILAQKTKLKAIDSERKKN